jgi:hypothetical protein
MNDSITISIVLLKSMYFLFYLVLFLVLLSAHSVILSTTTKYNIVNIFWKYNTTLFVIYNILQRTEETLSNFYSKAYK